MWDKENKLYTLKVYFREKLDRLNKTKWFYLIYENTNHFNMHSIHSTVIRRPRLRFSNLIIRLGVGIVALLIH